MNKKRISIIIACGLLFVAGISYCVVMSGCSKEPVLSTGLQEQEDGNDKADTPIPFGKSEPVTISTTPSLKEIYVHICGAVVHTGVYLVKPGARICDLIKLAGGLSSNAAGDYVNQAEQVSDGQRIYIPTLDEVKNLTTSELMEGNTGGTEASEKSSGLVNINTADAEALMTLPGIGQAKADSIIDYRNKNGGFKAIDELMSIPGIKEGVYNHLASLITVK